MSGWGATDSDESKPKWLTADQKEDVFANSSGWVVKAGSTMTGNGNTSATPEVLVALGSLATSLGQATIDAVDFVSTGFDVSDGGTISVNVHYNEEITVAGGSPLMYIENGQEGGGSASSVTLTMDGSLPFTGEKLTFSNTIGAGGSTISAGDVLSFAAQSIDLNGSTMVDKIGGGNAERAISAAQATAGGTITATA